MLELLLLLAAAVFLFVFFLLWAFRQWGTSIEAPPVHESQLTELVLLSGVSYPRVERLFDPADYNFLAGDPRLRDVARQFERDRRQAALLWLRLLQEDFEKLRRFHRALVAYGAKTDLRTESRLTVDAIFFQVVRPLLTTWIGLFGLYAIPRAHLALLVSVRQLSSLLATLVARLSPAQLAEIKQSWSAHELKVSLVK